MSLIHRTRHGLLSSLPTTVCSVYLLSCLLNFVLESLSMCSPLSAIALLIARPWVFLYNALIIACTLVLPLFFRRRTFVRTLLCALWGVLGIINFVMRIMRITPLGFYDFIIFFDNFSITNSYLSFGEIALILLGLIGLFTGLTLTFLRTGKAQPQRPLAACSLVLLAAFTLLVTPSYAYWAQDYSNPAKAYERFGFAYSLLRSAVDRGIARPETYTEKVIDDILPEGSVTDVSAAAAPNFVFLQLESFIDPALYRGVVCSENPVPTFTRLRDSCQSGYLHVPMVGGGTANVEFEVLTGMRLFDFGTGEYPYSTVLTGTVCESGAHVLRKLGYTTHAIHSNTATFYQRHKVFASLGFDTFTSLEYMNDYTTTPLGWCRDIHLLPCIMDALKSSTSRDLVFTVTVQGHGKYDAAAPAAPYAISASGIDEGIKNEFEYYIHQLQETDAFLQALLTELESYPEPVVLVLYGDHLPALHLPEDRLATGSYLITEYVVWSNQPLPSAADKDLYAYQLMSYLFGQYGISNGLLMRFHQQNSENDDYLEQLQQLEYDMLYGEHFLYDGEPPYERVALRFGLHEIQCASALWDGKALVVRGKNFTRSSIVHVNGNAWETLFIDSGTLAALPGLFADVSTSDSVSVAQLAIDGTILSATNAVTCSIQ